MKLTEMNVFTNIVRTVCKYVCIDIIVNISDTIAQATFSISLEEDMKNDIDAVCESFGMSMSAAFNVFARAFVRNRGFPFDVKLQEQKDP